MIYDNKNSPRTCTIPKIFGLRDWFENRFGDLCERHDFEYSNRTGKWSADMRLVRGMWDRGYWWLAVPTFLFVNTIGIFYYYT